MNKKLKIVIGIFFFIFVLFFIPFWKSISLASIFALAIYPYLPKNGKFVSGKIIVATVTLVSLLIISPFLIGIYSFSSSIINYSKQESNKTFNSENLKQNVSKKIDESIKSLNLPIKDKTPQIIEKISDSISETALSYSVAMISGIPDLVLEIIIFSLSLYTFLFYGSIIKAKIVSLHLLNKKDIDELSEILQKSSFQCLVTLIIVGGIQAAIVLIGAMIAGFSNWFLIFLITFILSFIPIIGAAPVAFSLALFRLFQGDTTMAIVLSVVGIIAGSIDNILKPLLVQRGIDFDGAISLITIIGSIAILGLPGLLIGPVVGTTVAHYFNKLS